MTAPTYATWDIFENNSLLLNISQVFLMCFCYQLHFPPMQSLQLPLLQLTCLPLPSLLNRSYLPYRFTHTAQSPQLTQTINHSDIPYLPVTPRSNHVRLYSSILDTPYQNRDAYDASSNDKLLQTLLRTEYLLHL
jgi:hypothetical protein